MNDIVVCIKRHIKQLECQKYIIKVGDEFEIEFEEWFHTKIHYKDNVYLWYEKNTFKKYFKSKNQLRKEKLDRLNLLSKMNK